LYACALLPMARRLLALSAEGLSKKVAGRRIRPGFTPVYLT
jgi:hypothetical protein